MVLVPRVWPDDHPVLEVSPRRVSQPEPEEWMARRLALGILLRHVNRKLQALPDESLLCVFRWVLDDLARGGAGIQDAEAEHDECSVVVAQDLECRAAARSRRQFRRRASGRLASPRAL